DEDRLAFRGGLLARLMHAHQPGNLLEAQLAWLRLDQLEQLVELLRRNRLGLVGSRGAPQGGDYQPDQARQPRARPHDISPRTSDGDSANQSMLGWSAYAESSRATNRWMRNELSTASNLARRRREAAAQKARAG